MREFKFRGWDGAHMNLSEDGSMEAFWAYADDHYGDGPAVMQFTGLKDKNGVEIYEGDILKPSAGGVPPLQVMDYKIKDVSGHTQEGHYTTVWAGFQLDGYWGDPKGWVVVGNIYQNPELLK
jgi:uncharacterized phage protein (TIGR01671 family)